MGPLPFAKTEPAQTTLAALSLENTSLAPSAASWQLSCKVGLLISKNGIDFKTRGISLGIFKGKT
jgi:hypothetical protein